ncbi:hypothetical protein CYMTET_3971 [Cymbomonas tetramitiformis]|uniref:glutathione-specific gamma-glutamylcyclotransferase n=1 Tax=Cymbomonas tetramitiformis TaxID=36881 RepID=A0AAE0LKV0_9CHLO|nr:hypothetical protein CYMTET_3971 [Cymbomonas tetramitiformis]
MDRTPAPYKVTPQVRFSDIPKSDLKFHNQKIMTWVFGYGSLVWRPSFEHTATLKCYVKDYARVWTQGSTDHRGTPSHPGRTVTLERRVGAQTWGTAYKLPEDKREQIIEYLEVREKQYDVREVLPLFTELSQGEAVAPAVEDALVYIATEESANYLGVATIDDLAMQMATARGPSGENAEYLYRLAEAMREMGVLDKDLYRLEEKVKALKAQMPGQT